MRSIIYGIMAVLIMAFFAGGVPNQDRYVIPLSNGTSVFPHNQKGGDSKPAFTVGTADRLMVIESKGDMYRVSDLKGEVGWVDKALVKVIRASEAVVFGEADVLGYLDNPTPVYIIDANNPVSNPLTLDRSFARELRENTDRMTLERIVGEEPPR